VGLVLHNVAMAQLWDLGVRGTALDAVAAWKETLLLVALLLVAWKVRRFPALRAADILAASYAIVIVVYWAIPQDVLGGDATSRGELLALRHHLFPVAAYALGRLVGIAWKESGRLGGLITLSAVVVAAVGLADLAFLSLHSWRESGVPGWYRELGLDYEGLSGLPENWVYNTGDENNPIRRLVSTFLSPLASAYVLVVALIYVVSRPLRWWWALLAALLYVALLYTHTRAALAAVALGLVLLALAQRRLTPAVLAAGSIVFSALFLAAYPSIGPSTSYTPEELEFLRQNAAIEGPATGGGRFPSEDASTESHWRNLRDGVRLVVEHPQGHGLGNSGVVAKRTRVEIRAGESTYTELGVDAGVAGAVAFVLWNLAILIGLWRREAWLAAAFATVLVIGLQTDVIGIHWIAFTVWLGSGLALGLPLTRYEGESEEPAEAVSE
jgi:hypothetical protein